VVVSEGAQRAQAYWQWQEERQAEKLREINRALLTTFELQQLTDVLVEHLPGLGIPSAYLALYDQSTGTPESARLILAYTEQGRAALEPGGMHFATRQLIPPGLLPHHRRHSLVVEPLYFQEKSIGYAVFEIGPHHSDIYELLRSNLSSALQGAMLFQEIRQARIIAEKADRVKTRLLANVSHELRTPLNIIIGYTQNILQAQEAAQTLEPTLESDIQHIRNHAEHQLGVINDLLDLSRAEIDELDLTLELIDPLPLLEEAFHSIADHTANPGLVWRTELPERLPLLRADPVRLRQVLYNLLSNAGKFTERGQVVLGGEVAPPNMHLWVCDTGWGISTEQQERIFEPFVTIEQAHDRQITGGIGLGLSITRHIVALHGGKMVLESEPGRGSTFHIYLPLPALEYDHPSTENAHPVLLVLTASGAPAPEIAEIASRQKLEIITIRQVEDIEAVLAEMQPLAVAWDLSSAQAGDWSLVRRLRHHPVISLAPFIVYGQQPESGSGKPVLNVGMTSFVVKSPQQQTLLDTINALCPAPPSGSILIVDDDPEVRQHHQALIYSGFPSCSIRLAESGESALEQMGEEVPALVLLDLVMPGLSGADVLDQMRADVRLRQVPVIILSNKFLSLDDIKRLEYHTRVTLQNKDIWTERESLDVIHRALAGDETLPAHTSALVKRVLVYIHQNYARPLTRWEIAQSVGISEDYLSRLFHRELGISPWDYLNRYRILKARMLLATTSHSIGAIARQVGFKDPAYFSRVFRKVVGMSPKELLDTKEK
jgi:signal transduction histidine kinase/AraC-like DNA-binding protein